MQSWKCGPIQRHIVRHCSPNSRNFNPHSLCSVHGRFENPSYLVLKLILALIWNIRSPFQFSKCRNSRVKTINFATIDAITMALGLRTFRKDRSRIRSRLITRIPRQFAYPKVPTTTRFYAIAYPRVKKSTNRYAKNALLFTDFILIFLSLNI